MITNILNTVAYTQSNSVGHNIIVKLLAVAVIFAGVYVFKLIFKSKI
jgi:hypothetical protein